MDKNWTQDAKCVPHTDLYLSLEHSITDSLRPDDLYRLAQAKRNCLACPVRQNCLEDAMQEELYLSAIERHGIRGGLTAPERSELASQDLRCSRCNEQPRQSSPDPRKFTPLCKSCQIAIQNDFSARYFPQTTYRKVPLEA